MDCSSTTTSSTTTSSAADNQLSSDKDSQTLFDEESIESIIAQIKATRVVNPQQQLTDILCSYLNGKNYSPKFIDQHLDKSFFGERGYPSAIFQAFGSDVIDNYRYSKPRYSNVTFLEVYKNRSQAGIYKNIYTHIKWTARQMIAGVRKSYNLLPVERSKRNTSGEFAQSMVVKIFIAFNLI
jgi:hypothetical protein